MFEQEVNCLLVTFLGCSLSGIKIVRVCSNRNCSKRYILPGVMCRSLGDHPLISGLSTQQEEMTEAPWTLCEDPLVRNSFDAPSCCRAAPASAPRSSRCGLSRCSRFPSDPWQWLLLAVTGSHHGARGEAGGEGPLDWGWAKFGIQPLEKTAHP